MHGIKIRSFFLKNGRQYIEPAARKESFRTFEQLFERPGQPKLDLPIRTTGRNEVWLELCREPGPGTPRANTPNSACQESGGIPTGHIFINNLVGKNGTISDFKMCEAPIALTWIPVRTSWLFFLSQTCPFGVYFQHKNQNDPLEKSERCSYWRNNQMSIN